MAIYEPVFKALNQAGVRYVVVGGLAVAMQGYARFTADVDLVVDLEEDQAARAIEVLTALNLRPRAPVDARDFISKAIRETWIRDRGMQVFSLYDPSDPMRVVDLFVSHPIPFEELWARSEETALSGVTVKVASIPDLIWMKRESGRSEDLSDIEHLEAILRERKGSEGA